MIPVDSKSIALFFFFALLDENRAIEATAEAIQNAKNRISKNVQLKPEVALVAATHHIWEKHRGRFNRGRPNYSSESGWLLPDGIDMGPWKEFQKSAQEDEFLALIWSHILKISDQDISLGLGISIGTLRYRTGRALRRLGALTNPVSTKGSGPQILGIIRDE
jgi:hypothetical protein